MSNDSVIREEYFKYITNDAPIEFMGYGSNSETIFAAGYLAALSGLEHIGTAAVTNFNTSIGWVAKPNHNDCLYRLPDGVTKP